MPRELLTNSPISSICLFVHLFTLLCTVQLSTEVNLNPLYCLFVVYFSLFVFGSCVCMYLPLQVLEVSRLLGLDTTEYDEDASISQGQGETLILLIRAGLEQNDITVAVKLCQEVMHVRLSTGWKVCR